jgi:hypothetical protein
MAPVFSLLCVNYIIRCIHVGSFKFFDPLKIIFERKALISKNNHIKVVKL